MLSLCLLLGGGGLRARGRVSAGKPLTRQERLPGVQYFLKCSVMRPQNCIGEPSAAGEADRGVTHLCLLQSGILWLSAFRLFCADNMAQASCVVWTCCGCRMHRIMWDDSCVDDERRRFGFQARPALACAFQVLDTEGVMPEIGEDWREPRCNCHMTKSNKTSRQAPHRVGPGPCLNLFRPSSSHLKGMASWRAPISCKLCFACSQVVKCQVLLPVFCCFRHSVRCCHPFVVRHRH